MSNRLPFTLYGHVINGCIFKFHRWQCAISSYLEVNNCILQHNFALCHVGLLQTRAFITKNLKFIFHKKKTTNMVSRVPFCCHTVLIRSWHKTLAGQRKALDSHTPWGTVQVETRALNNWSTGHSYPGALVEPDCWTDRMIVLRLEQKQKDTVCSLALDRKMIFI